MKRQVFFLAVFFCVLIAIGLMGWCRVYQVQAPSSSVMESSPSSSTTSSEEGVASTPAPTPTASVGDTSSLVQPIAEFRQRISKKPFGLYVNPQNSPVSPERFTGYHTAVDIEYADVITDVSVVAVEAGTIVRSGWVGGYGGLLVIKSELHNEPVFYLYGHLRPSSLKARDASVSKGESIGVLGTAFSPETDNERRHLHFAIIRGTELDVRGYVSRETELIKWIDPATVIQ